MMVIYGTQVMRGVTEEKTNRVAEVIISSVKPFELMMGKILGIGAVGLTQFGIWMILLLSMQSIIPVFFPDLMNQVSSNAIEGQSEKMAAIGEVMHGFASLPIAKIILSFVFYFLGGFLTYASIFAAIGSVVSEDQQEAQQLVFPVMMPIVVGFVIMSKAVNDPNSTAAVVGSIFPLTSPIVMMGRITYDVPVWEMALSMSLLVVSFLFFTWVTAKIYRTGILMYGKRPGWKEMIKWTFRKS
jgi:ABC-2 type transport system permease protein